MISPLKTIDYFDCFQGRIKAEPPPLLREIVYQTFSFEPKWVKILFAIRNYLVIPFGLKRAKGKQAVVSKDLPFIWEKNGKVAFFDLIDFTDDEAILIIRDKHLDAGVVITRSHADGTTLIAIKTIVQYNNKLGWAYFNLIKPFHRLIIKSMIKQIIKSYKP